MQGVAQAPARPSNFQGLKACAPPPPTQQPAEQLGNVILSLLRQALKHSTNKMGVQIRWRCVTPTCMRRPPAGLLSFAAPKCI